MALQAKDDFPDIDFLKSIMAGDSISDMLFAKNAGMRGVFIGNKYGPGEVSKTLYQAHYADLLSFAQAFFLYCFFSSASTSTFCFKITLRTNAPINPIP